MEPIISLPYSEFEVITQINRYFKKNKGFSICVPTSRQQKGFDFVLVNNNNAKLLRFQVKSSRHYADKRFRYNFWFSNFYSKYKSGLADVYIFFGLYPVYNVSKNIKSRSGFWKSFALAFTDKEMGIFLDSIKTKGEKKRDRFFAFSFNDPTSEIVVSRGQKGCPSVSNFLLKNRVHEILKLL